MTMGPEAKIEQETCRRAKALGISNLKLEGMHNRGKADRIFMRHGRTCFVEFKAPPNKPTVLQERFLLERREDGFPAVWCDDVDEAIKWLKHHLLRDE
ncbi:MAG: hypothetical protein WC718_00310 [Phycisphaerales bacterium]|jgi:hypothetical protein